MIKPVEKTMAAAVKTWRFIRKPTTPVHLLYGLFCCFLIWQFGWLVGLVMMGGFALWERWNDNEILRRQELCHKYGLPFTEANYLKTIYLPEGAMDFWESTVTFIIGLVILAILEAKGIVVMTWL